MSVKTVTVNITSHPLSREENGVVFKIKKGNAKFGKLVVSKGESKIITTLIGRSLMLGLGTIR